MTDAVSFIYVPDDDRLREGDYLDACAVMTTSGRVASYKTRVPLTPQGRALLCVLAESAEAPT